MCLCLRSCSSDGWLNLSIELDELRNHIRLDLTASERSQLVVDDIEVLLITYTLVCDGECLGVFQRKRVADDDVLDVTYRIGEVILIYALQILDVGIVFLQLQRLVIVLHTYVVVVDSQVLQNVKSLRMSYLQFLVDIKCLLEMMTFLVEFSLDVEQGFIVWAKGKTLAYELLKVGIVLVVDTQIYSRRNDVIVGRIVIRCLFESDDGKLIFVGLCASLDEVDEYRFAVLLVTRTEISLQIWNSFLILAAVY